MTALVIFSVGFGLIWSAFLCTGAIVDALDRLRETLEKKP